MGNLRTLVVGAGVFGAAAAIELARRGHAVTVLDPGPLPHPLAASTDVSKAVRMDYGPDEDYLALMESALEGWRAWNLRWREELFHEAGVTYLCRAPMAPGGFEYESFHRMTARGHRPERLGSDEIRRRFPAWNADLYVDGYYNPEGGYAESARVVERLIADARTEGVVLREGVAIERLLERPGGRVGGVTTRSGESIEADTVVFCAGAWSPHALPWLAGALHSVGMPVFHLRPADPTLFLAERFPTFGADISRTGYYGFPLDRGGIVKIAYHGAGRAMHPESRAREVTADETERMRAFVAESFPALARAPVVYTRVCLYCDTRDGHFWIAPDPERPGLVVAAGGSGHAFKFAPVLGGLIADAVEGQANPWLHKFRWRPDERPARGEEAARRYD